MISLFSTKGTRMKIAFAGFAKVSETFPLLQVQSTSFCTKNKNSNSNGNKENRKCEDFEGEEGSMSKHDAYRQLEKLDFATAAKILFTNPPKKKKFGIDFHLVQLFFVCMPSLAVYLVAQYARYEMRKMEAELEKKRQAEEEKKAKEAEEEKKVKELESKATEEKAARSDSELLEVKVRLDKLEKTIKEIAVESKVQPDHSTNRDHEDVSEKTQAANVEPNDAQRRSEESNSATEDHHSKQNLKEIPPALPRTDASNEDLRGKSQNTEE